MLQPRSGSRATSSLLLLVLLVAMAALVAGCGSDTNSEKASNSKETPSSETADDGDDEEEVEEEPESNGGGETSGDTEYERLTALQGDARYEVTYEMTTTLAGPNDAEPTTQEMTFAVDGDKVAITTEDVTMYQLGSEGLVSCSDDGTGKQSCIQLPGTGDAATAQQLGALAGQFGSATDAFNEDAEGVERSDDEEIAGRDATCWTFEYAFLGSGVDAKSCLKQETGAPLLMSWGSTEGEDASGSFESRAIEFSADVTAADFTPPATPLDLGAMEDASPEEMAEMMEQLQGGAGAEGEGAPAADL